MQKRRKKKSSAHKQKRRAFRVLLVIRFSCLNIQFKRAKKKKKKNLNTIELCISKIEIAWKLGIFQCRLFVYRLVNIDINFFYFFFTSSSSFSSSFDLWVIWSIRNSKVVFEIQFTRFDNTISMSDRDFIINCDDEYWGKPFCFSKFHFLISW